MENNNNRIEWVDYLKAFACFLVVLGHLIQSLQKAHIDKNVEITSFINWFIYLFHMPLFMCMSGFLYYNTKHEFSWLNYKKFEYKKIINLIVPYFSFYILFVGINMIFANEVNSVKGFQDLVNIFNNPMPPYWFLYAILSIFIIIPLIEKVCRNNSKIVFAILIIFKVISINVNIHLYFIASIFKYGIYFYLGAFIEKEKKEKDLKNIIFNAIMVVFYVIICILIYKTKLKEDDYINIIMAILGIIICVGIFKLINKHIILNSFKKYTFQIYLIHTICAAGIRIVLLKIGVANYWIHFIMGIIFSVYVPVIISIISKKIVYTDFFFYPLKTIKELKERKNNDGKKIESEQ